MKDTDHRQGPGARSRKLGRRATVLITAMVAFLSVGIGTASGDTSTGFDFTIECGTLSATLVSPTSPAAVAQDVDSSRVFVLAVGALVAPAGKFPENKLMTCTLHNLTTGNTFEDLPFLITPTH